MNAVLFRKFFSKLIWALYFIWGYSFYWWLLVLTHSRTNNMEVKARVPSAKIDLFLSCYLKFLMCSDSNNITSICLINDYFVSLVFFIFSDYGATKVKWILFFDNLRVYSYIFIISRSEKEFNEIICYNSIYIVKPWIKLYVQMYHFKVL